MLSSAPLPPLSHLPHHQNPSPPTPPTNPLREQMAAGQLALNDRTFRKPDFARSQVADPTRQSMRVPANASAFTQIVFSSSVPVALRGNSTMEASARIDSSSGALIGTLMKSSQSQSPPEPSMKSRMNPTTSSADLSVDCPIPNSLRNRITGTARGSSANAFQPVMCQSPILCECTQWLSEAVSFQPDIFVGSERANVRVTYKFARSTF